jgi:hypothetical protein
MEGLLRDAERDAVDLAAGWEKAKVNQRQELIKSFFPEGLVFSTKNGFIEPANTVLGAVRHPPTMTRVFAYFSGCGFGRI